MATANPKHQLQPLIRKLESIAPVQEDEKQALGDLPLTLRQLNRDQDIVRERDRPSQCCIVLDGFAYRYKILPSGNRQIFAFHIPGDIPDVQSLHLRIMDHDIGTVTPTKVAFIPHEIMRAFLRAHPRISDAFWRDTLIEAAMFREWMAGIGRRDAYARLAHFFCELFIRLRAVGLADGNGYGMPITQTALADALGLSTVHVNRSLQQLRRNGLITTRNGRTQINDWDGLQAAGEFDPTYLHLNSELDRLEDLPRGERDADTARHHSGH
jgi:CRP-like cAMP-binding protein